MTPDILTQPLLPHLPGSCPFLSVPSSIFSRMSTIHKVGFLQGNTAHCQKCPFFDSTPFSVYTHTD